jgi:hypothetical protein
MINEPFLPDQHPFLTYFPPIEYSMMIPTLLLVISVTGVLGFLAVVLIQG